MGGFRGRDAAERGIESHMDHSVVGRVRDVGSDWERRRRRRERERVG